MKNSLIPQKRISITRYMPVLLTIMLMVVIPKALATANIEGCSVFPSDNIWNVPVDTLPVDTNSSLYVDTIGKNTGLHPDFGTVWEGKPIGIPYNIVSGSQPKVNVIFDYADESDKGPYPIPAHPLIEAGDDHHILILDKDNCILYELYATYQQNNGNWHAGSGAIFNLKSNTLRPSGWTSADAAGLPILPGLVRYNEVTSGEIPHAIRFTAPNTQKLFVWPARHYASNLTAIKYPPMGQRFRLKAGVDISRFSPGVQVILRAMKKYGIILADNGSSWFISGVPDQRWDDDILVNELQQIKGSDFEAVNTSSLMVNADSGQARQMGLNTNPPSEPVNLIFIHHSTGENWLADDNGRLGIALRNNNYFVSDTNYGWGPDGIGDYTDIGHWWRWFRGPSSPTYLRALYREKGMHSSYSRLSQAQPGGNKIIMFKSCFPNSALKGNPNDIVPPINRNRLRGKDSSSKHLTVANAKGIYIDLLNYFRTRQDKLFIVITAPPLSDTTDSGNARAFNEWLINDWLDNYPYKNVAVFDFYNVLTTNGGNADKNDLDSETGNHHRFWNNVVQHKIDGDNDSNSNILEYPSGDDHPSQAGNLKASGEFPAILNIYYHQWKGE